MGRSCLEKYVSYEKPAYWDSLASDYTTFFDATFGGPGKIHRLNNLSISRPPTGIIGGEAVHEEVDLFVDHCVEEERANDGEKLLEDDSDDEDENQNAASFSADKRKKKKFKIAQDTKQRSFFKTFCAQNMIVRANLRGGGVDDDDSDFSERTMTEDALTCFNTVVVRPYNYGVNYGYVLDSFSAKALGTQNVYLNYPGGFVPELISKCFSRGDDDLLVNIIDFNSLYPSVMNLYNICTTTISFDTQVPVRIGNRHYSQYDPKDFFIYTVKLKINDATLPVVLFLAKDHLIKSIISGYITNNTAERKTYKNLMKRFDASSPEYMQANNFQLALKLRDNSRYGFFNSLFSPLFQPLLASSVTYFGRLKLCSLHFFTIYYFWKKRVALERRGPIYGDTDSLFMVCTRREIDEITLLYKNLGSSRGIMAVDIEKSIPYMLFLTKKNYIALHDSKIYMKGVLKKSQTIPAKTFLTKFIEIIFTRVFLGLDYKESLVQILGSFFRETADEEFNNKRVVSKELSGYKNKNVMWLLQLEHLSAQKNFTVVRGTKISFTYYRYIFDFKLKYQCQMLAAEISREEERKQLLEAKNESTAAPMIAQELKKSAARINSIKKKLARETEYLERICGTLDYTNADQLDFIRKFRPTHSLLIDELKDDYAGKLEVDKFRMFLCDLEAIINHIFDSMGNEDFKRYFEESFLEETGLNFAMFAPGVKREPAAKKTKSSAPASSQKKMDDFFKKIVEKAVEKNCKKMKINK